MLVTANPNRTLWEAPLPAECLEMAAELEAVDGVLDDPVFFEPYRRFFDPIWGRPGIPVETYLRLMYLKFRHGLSFEAVVREAADSPWRPGGRPTAVPASAPAARRTPRERRSPAAGWASCGRTARWAPVWSARRSPPRTRWRGRWPAQMSRFPPRAAPDARPWRAGSRRPTRRKAARSALPIPMKVRRRWPSQRCRPPAGPRLPRGRGGVAGQATRDPEERGPQREAGILPAPWRTVPKPPAPRRTTNPTRKLSCSGAASLSPEAADHHGYRQCGGHEDGDRLGIGGAPRLQAVDVPGGGSATSSGPSCQSRRVSRYRRRTTARK